VCTRDVGERIVGVGRIVGSLSMSLDCCRRSCTLLRYVLMWQGCEPRVVWSRGLTECCVYDSVCSIRGCVGCHIGLSSFLLLVFR